MHLPGRAGETRGRCDRHRVRRHIGTSPIYGFRETLRPAISRNEGDVAPILRRQLALQ